MITAVVIAQIIHDGDCPGCPAQPLPHAVPECLYTISREKHLKAANAIMSEVERELYEAYLLGCEDECIPEPKTFERFIESFKGQISGGAA